MINYSVLDIECTFQKLDDGSSDNRPYNPENKLVSLGLKHHAAKECAYYMFEHSELADREALGTAKILIQKYLDETELLVGHNIKFDLAWIRECGFVYEGKIWDTMLTEKILSGNSLYMNELSLDQCCARIGIAGKIDEVAAYWDKGVSTDMIPWPVLEKYGIQDCMATEKLFINQWRRVYNA